MIFTAVVIAVLAVHAGADPQREALAEGRLTFEAATIKRAAPDAVRNRVMPTSSNRLFIPSMSLVWLIYTAFGDGGYNTGMRVTGGPDWVNRTAFAVEAIASGTATPRQLRLMLRTLLEERFALKVRTETQIGEGLALVMERPDGALGPKVKEWNGTCTNGTPLEADEPATPRCRSGYRAGGITLDGATMFTVAEVLSLPQSRSLLGGVTTDQTGLKGRYTMELDYEFVAQPSAGPAPAASADFAGPTLVTAIQEQWGLRLVRRRGPFKVIVVESAQPPTAD